MTTKIHFKEWLPDLPALDNPGMTEVLNCRPIDATYKHFRPLGAAVATLPSLVPLGGVQVINSSGSPIVYAGDETSLSASTGGAFTELSASTYGSDGWDFAVYENIVCAADIGIPIQRHTIGSAGNFATLGSTAGTAPPAKCIGVVGQFLVAGWADSVRNRLRWSGIDNISSWPTAGSATAIAQQAGEQDLDDWGGIYAIGGGDQFAVIWQQSGMHRMTYVGGDVVFQFDVLSRNIGTTFRNSVVHYNGRWYFASRDGFFVTDGASVAPIGRNKVDRYFSTNVDGGFNDSIFGAVDPAHGLIYWSFPVSGGSGDGVQQEILLYNALEERWARASETTRGLIKSHVGSGTLPYAFRSNGAYTTFTGTAGSAVLISGESELNPGGFAYVSGVKPLVDVTTNSVTVALGTRSNQQNSPTYTNLTTANSRSGFCDFRSEARYHRVRFDIQGTFNACQGLEIRVAGSGEV